LTGQLDFAPRLYNWKKCDLKFIILTQCVAISVAITQSPPDDHAMTSNACHSKFGCRTSSVIGSIVWKLHTRFYSGLNVEYQQFQISIKDSCSQCNGTCTALEEALV